MKYCYYPAIILFILSTIPIIIPIRNGFLPPVSSIIFSSVPLFFGILSIFLCNKGYNKLAWISPLGIFIVYFYIVINL